MNGPIDHFPALRRGAIKKAMPLDSNEIEAANRAEATATLLRAGYRVYRPEAFDGWRIYAAVWHVCDCNQVAHTAKRAACAPPSDAAEKLTDASAFGPCRRRSKAA
jgi:hypothetical protein